MTKKKFNEPLFYKVSFTPFEDTSVEQTVDGSAGSGNILTFAAWKDSGLKKDYDEDGDIDYVDYCYWWRTEMGYSGEPYPEDFVKPEP